MAFQDIGSDERQKKLEYMLADFLRVGSVRGFMHFRFYLRGREELLVSVVNNVNLMTPLASPSSSFHEPKMLPRNQSSLMLSARTQRSLSGFGYMDVGLPPASPSDNEWLDDDPSVTVFLIAAYSKYCCPYVWVRTNHERLIKLSGNTPEEKDNPLKLKSTAAWATEDTKIWDIVTELVEVCAAPVPSNPFAVDFSFFECLSTNEAIVASGAMVQTLQRLLQSTTPRYHTSIVRDLQRLLKLHFEQLLAQHRAEARQLRPRTATLEDLIPSSASSSSSSSHDTHTS